MRISKNIFVASVSLLVAVGALVALNVTGTASHAVGSYRDCEADTIIKCGALTTTELLEHYDANVGDVQHIYSHYGISRDDIAGKTSEIKSGTVYQDGRVVVNGETVATGAYSLSRLPFISGSGEHPRTVTINGTTLYEGPNMSIFVRPVDAFVMFRNGQFYKAVLSACGNPLLATPVKPPVQPVTSCDSLTATKIDRTNFKFTSAATAKNGAEIVSYTYDFGDSTVKTVTSSTINHTYAKPGTYTITMSVTVKVNGTTKTITAAACKTTVKVEAVPVTPLYACNSLTAQIVAAKANTYAYTLSYTAEGGATLNKVTYNFGDSTALTVDAAKASPVQHTYAKAGSYRTTAALTFNVKNGTEVAQKTINCEVAINITPEMCTLPGKEMYPKNSPECATVEMCTVSGKETFPKNSPECAPTEMCKVPGKENLPKNSTECVETPPELPHTGMGDFLSGGLGLSSITAAGYYFVNSRKSLVAALLRR